MHQDDLTRLIPKSVPYSSTYGYHSPSLTPTPAPSSYAAMELKRGKFTIKLVASYAFDWVILLAMGGLSGWFSNMTPNKRPFQLEDPNISYVAFPDCFGSAVAGC